MTVFQAAILGFVQGFTELFPISSSAHLILFPNIFGWMHNTLAFDTTLHLGTALALIVYFWEYLVSILKTKFSIVINILIASIPAGILGFLLNDIIEVYFRSNLSAIAFLIIGSVLMLFAEKKYTAQIENVGDVTTRKSFLIGLFQSLALFSGMSRSGSTISGGMLMGLSREAAAKFSFLISIPIVAVAGLYEGVSSLDSLLAVPWYVLFVGFLASFISGLFSVKVLMSLLSKYSLKPFIVYRFIVVVAALFLLF